ncbi:hypothetical protein BJV78DRAFT_1278697 [Lactifluus subvellereus]|nr:hypothetical protein BJV78DRAFT_1278697 [Lactifluus subvellereus]
MAQIADSSHRKYSSNKNVCRKEGDANAVPRTPSLSALSLLRPPPCREQPVFPSYGVLQGDTGSSLDALERYLVEQVGTHRHPPLPPEMGAILPPVSAPAPPPPPVSVPLPVLRKSVTQEADEVGAGTAVNESAISSLGEDADADGRMQRQGKGASTSSGKGDSEKDKERRKRKDKDEREVWDDEAACLRHAAKGHVAVRLGNLEIPEPVPEPVLPAMGKTISEDEKDRKPWDSNAITPGTPFMELLTKSLWYWFVQN